MAALSALGAGAWPQRAPGAMAFPRRKERGLLSRSQASNNTGGNSTFAFAPGAVPRPGRQGPKRRNPRPRRTAQQKQSGRKEQDLKDFPWHSNHRSQRGRSCGWAGIGTFRFAKVASGSRSLVSRHFSIKLENCPPLAGSTFLVRAKVEQDLWNGQAVGRNIFSAGKMKFTELRASATLSTTRGGEIQS